MKRHGGEDGQAVVLFALLLLVMMGMAAVVVDGGYGFVQARRAQNAADLASIAATGALQTACAGGAAATNASVTALIDDVVGANAPDAASRWSGVYVDQSGAGITGTALPASTGNAPPAACGVQITVSPQWRAFVAQILGVPELSTQAAAAAVVGNNPQATAVAHSAGIVALAPYGIHTIWGGGSGEFQITGNIMDNSAGNCSSSGCNINTDNPTGNCSSSGCYADTVDDFGSSGTVITGKLDGVAPVPLDPCFDPAGPTSATCPNHTSGTISYGGGMVGSLQPEPDPLAYEPAPTTADTACPGLPAQTFTSSPGTEFTPGVYNYPVDVTGDATFADCGNGAPGIYIFNDGLNICPGAGQSVTGSDILLYSAAAPAGAGKGGACGSMAKGMGPASGPEAVYLGGTGAITLSAAASGRFAHMLLYQNRSQPSNIGFDTHTTDSATIDLTGALYDNSETMLTPPPSPPPSGCTAGTMASGGGSGGGNITLDGVVIVDCFATAGTANVNITFDASQVPGVGPVLVR